MMCAVCDEKIRRTLKLTHKFKIRYNVMKSSRDRALETEKQIDGHSYTARRRRKRRHQTQWTLAVCLSWKSSVHKHRFTRCSKARLGHLSLSLLSKNCLAERREWNSMTKKENEYSFIEQKVLSISHTVSPSLTLRKTYTGTDRREKDLDWLWCRKDHAS